MKDDDLKMPQSHIRDKAIEIERHNMSVPLPVPKSHDDHLGVQHLAGRHHRM